MSQARFTSTGRAYGLKRVCALWGLARSTVYAQRRREAVPVHERPTPNKRGPVGPCTDAELLGHIRQVLEDSPFHGEGYRKVWARLRFAGIRTSKERVRRLMREAGLQAPHRVGKPRGPKAHNGTIRTERPDRMWGTHMTTTVTTEEGMASVFVAVDHCSVDCVGIHARAATASRPWSRSGRGSPSASPAWRRTSPRGLKFVTTTAPPICPMTFSGRSPTWA